MTEEHHLTRRALTLFALPSPCACQSNFIESSRHVVNDTCWRHVGDRTLCLLATKALNHSLQSFNCSFILEILNIEGEASRCKVAEANVTKCQVYKTSWGANMTQHHTQRWCYNRYRSHTVCFPARPSCKERGIPEGLHQSKARVSVLELAQALTCLLGIPWAAGPSLGSGMFGGITQPIKTSNLPLRGCHSCGK